MPVSADDLARTLLRRARERSKVDDEHREICLREVQRVIQDLRPALGFRQAWIIGSLAWGGFGLRSDIDLVVEGATPEAISCLRDRVEEVTGRNADVLSLEKLPPSFHRRVPAEGRHVA